jgi:hypothetical protein
MNPRHGARFFALFALVIAADIFADAPDHRAAAYQGAPAELRVVTRTVATGRAIRCDARLYALNATPPNVMRSHLGPPTYLAADAGRTGTPRLNGAQRRTIETIARYVRHPKTLRFTLLNGELVVFDAVDGPCSAAAPGYQVLNVRSCNTGYMPGDVDNATTTALPDCFSPARPWIPHDRGAEASGR